jgi:hypothetical protein
MKKLKLDDFLKLLDSYLDGNIPLKVMRDFIFSIFESEDNFEIDTNLSEALPVLAPYFEYEEAFGDPKGKTRLRRLRQILEAKKDLKERVVFALEFDRIMSLVNKLNLGLITLKIFNEQLEKLSPAPFDLQRISLWANSHKEKNDVDNKKII